VAKKLRDQCRHLVAAPRPATGLGQTFFVDIEDDDTLIDTALVGQTQTSVVNERIERIEQWYLIDPGLMTKENQSQQHTERDPNEIFSIR
jgi:hypothetical protein